MKIIFRVFVGVLNAFMFLSILVNSEFWRTWGRIVNVANARTIENFASFGTQFSSYIAFALMSGYCFSYKLRAKEKYWNLVFVVNGIELLVIMFFIIAVQFVTSNKSGAGAMMMLFAPLGLLFATNVGLLLSLARPKIAKEEGINEI